MLLSSILTHSSSHIPPPPLLHEVNVETVHRRRFRTTCNEGIEPSSRGKYHWQELAVSVTFRSTC